METLPIEKQYKNLPTSARGVIFDNIVSLVLQGYRRGDIIEKVKDLGVSVRTTERLIKKAREYIYNRPQETVERKRNIATQMCEEVYRSATHHRDKMDALKQWCRLQGLDTQDINIHHHKHTNIDDSKLIEIVLNNEANT